MPPNCGYCRADYIDEEEQRCPRCGQWGWSKYFVAVQEEFKAMMEIKAIVSWDGEVIRSE